MNLPVLAVTRDVVIEIRRHRTALIKALTVPALLLVIIELALATEPLSRGVWLLFTLLNLIVASLFAVNCHRIVLRGPDTLPRAHGLYLDRRVWGYTGFVVAFYIVGFIAAMLLVIPVGLIMGDSWDGIGLFYLLLLALMVASFYLLARFGMVFPSVAVGDGLDVGQSFALTRNNGWRIVLAVGIPTLIAILIVFALAFPVGLINEFLGELAASVLSYLMGAVVVIAISVTYRTLVQNAAGS